MFRNYLKIALRHLKKNKGFSLLNMFGLAMGLTCAILILLWIEDEVGYNKFHRKYDHIFQVEENQQYDGKIYTFGATPGPLAEDMKNDFPEVVNTSRMDWGNRWLFKLNDKTTYENGNFVDPGFLNIFSFDVIYGDKTNALANEHSVVITERMAKKYFGDTNPVGKYIKVNNKEDFQITAVVTTPPKNSTLWFDWLASYEIFKKKNPWSLNWASNGVQTFLELKPGTDVEKFNKKFKEYIHGKNSDAVAKPFLFAMKDWRLRFNFVEGKQEGGRIEYVRLFGFIALLLVIIACINFMNLATARSEQRAKEVGVRKVMGAMRVTLMKQFIGESVFMSFVATLVACIMVLAVLPAFNELVNKKLTLGASDPVQWLIFCSIALLCGFISGSYPSVYLSSFKPITIFKGLSSGKTSRAVFIRKGLVITQFVISIVLIVSTVVIYKQIQHVKNRQLGFNQENLIYLNQKGKINENLEIIENDLLATGVVSHVATAAQYILQEGSNGGGFEWKGKEPGKDLLITQDYVSPDYIAAAGMKLASGRNFYSDSKRDSNNILINEAFAKLIREKNVVGTEIRNDNNKYTVVGVIKDFVYNDMYQSPQPMILFCQPHSTNFMFIRFTGNVNIENALAKIEGVFKKDNSGYPFEYKFMDQEFDKLFSSEMLISKLSRLFAILTIVISSLGLFGLAAYTAERRTKEIGIRKVLGATIANVVTLLSKDFLKLVCISIIIATPVAWYVMNKWLQDYAYRIDIQWWIFALAGSLAILIASLTVSSHAVKAAIANPVKSLRTE